MTGEQFTNGIMTFGQELASKVRVIPLHSLQRVVYAILGAWLLYAVVQLIWLLVPDSQNTAAGAAAIDKKDGKPAALQAATVDIKRLQSYNLFGQLGEQQTLVEVAEPDQPDDVELNAAKTRLNLELKGIVAASESASAVAIIVHKGKQEQYHIGEKIPVGNRVSLAKVLNDHVILDNAGNYESLWLYDDSKLGVSVNQPARNRPAPRTSRSSKIKDMRKNAQATTLATDYRKRLYKNPKSLAEVLRIAPAQQDGQMVGYRVSPGRDRAQFTQLGFKANDIVTSINDISLDEPSQALEVYKLMRTATEASFTVLRNGEKLELMVALGTAE